jgi:hypothetical protein
LKIPGTLSVPSANPRKMHSCFAGLGLILPLDLQRIAESRIFQKSALKGSSERLVLFGFAPNTLVIESTPNTSPLRRPLQLALKNLTFLHTKPEPKDFL